MLLKVRFLKKCHTETRRGRRIIKTKQWKSRRHRRCIERRSLFANSISNLYTKRLFQSIYQESVCYTSVALCAVGTSVTLRYLRPLRDSVCILYKTFNLSLHISEEPYHGGINSTKSGDAEKIKDVRKQYHSNRNYTFCGLMTNLSLTNEANLSYFTQCIP